jgi:hypothetical protein
MGEKRIDTRRAITYRCWIVSETDQEMIACQIHDISKSGARLSVAGSVIVPNEFTLALTQDSRITRRCQVAWSEGELFGIKFVKEKIQRRAETRKLYC